MAFYTFDKKEPWNIENPANVNEGKLHAVGAGSAAGAAIPGERRAKPRLCLRGSLGGSIPSVALRALHIKKLY